MSKFKLTLAMIGGISVAVVIGITAATGYNVHLCMHQEVREENLQEKRTIRFKMGKSQEDKSTEEVNPSCSHSE